MAALRRKNLLPSLLFLFLFVLLIAKIIVPLTSKAQTASPQTPTTNSTATSTGTGDLASEIEEFFSKGAQGYLVWQYSGEQAAPFETDKYSFFKGDPICDVIKSEAAKHPDKFLGVNIHSFAKYPDRWGDTLSWLKANCGTTVVRIWGTPELDADPIGSVTSALDAAQAAGVKLIVVASDFSNVIGPANPDPTSWYSGNAAYNTHLTKLAAAVKDKPALFEIELSNEPHCQGQPQCVSAYVAWAARASQLIKSIGPGIKVGIGQMASHNQSLGDSPGPGDFKKSNSAGSIDMTSGHYYSQAEKDVVLTALSQSKELNKPFYIGEAPATLASKISQYFEYNIQRKDANTILKNFYDEYSTTCMPKQQYDIAFSNRTRCDTDPNARCNPGWNENWDVPGQLHITTDGKLFGLMRNEDSVNSRINKNINPNNRFESIESFMSVHEIGQNIMSTANTSNTSGNPAFANTLYSNQLYMSTTLAQQCMFIKNKLRAVKELCKSDNRIEGDTSQCAIDNPVAGTTYQSQTALYDAMGGDAADCIALMNPAPGNKREEDLRDAILHVSPNMEMAYRPAFIVAVTNFDGPPTSSGANATVDVKNSKGNTLFSTIDYLEVKVPSFASDFIPPDAFDKSNPDKNNVARDSYRDPSLLSADTLRILDQQNDAKKVEFQDREVIRKTGSDWTQFLGNNNHPIFCYDSNHNLTSCDPTTMKDDQLPPALLSFINSSIKANGQIKVKDGPDLPCEADEDAFYDPKSIKKIAEQAQSIGSKLTPAEQIGNYKKKTDLTVDFSIHVKDIRQAVTQSDLHTHTQLYFVGPHKYALRYIQQSYLAFLTQDQQKLIKEKVLSTEASLDPDKFSTLLKTPFDDKIAVGGDPVDRSEPLFVPNAKPNPDGSIPTNSFNIEGQVGPLLENGQPKKRSLFWDFAGQVASLPTRLWALVTTPYDHPLNVYTRLCTGDHATEDWLAGKCGANKSSNTNPATASNSGTIAGKYCIQWVVSAADAAKIKAEVEQNLASFPHGSRALLWTHDVQCSDDGSTDQSCSEYILNKCADAGYNPAICVAMNISESGGSDPDLGKFWDFGCGVDPTRGNNVSVGLRCLVGDFFARNRSKNYNDMFLQFAGSNGFSSYSYQRLANIYNKLVPDGYLYSPGECK